MYQSTYALKPGGVPTPLLYPTSRGCCTMVQSVLDGGGADTFSLGVLQRFSPPPLNRPGEIQAKEEGLGETENPWQNPSP